MALIGLLDLAFVALLILVFVDDLKPQVAAVLAWIVSVGLAIFGPPIL